MNEMRQSKSKKEVKKKMSGWLIALIIVAVMFIAGAICCNTIGKAQGNAKNATQSSAEIKK